MSSESRQLSHLIRVRGGQLIRHAVFELSIAACDGWLLLALQASGVRLRHGVS